MEQVRETKFPELTERSEVIRSEMVTERIKIFKDYEKNELNF